MQKTTKNETDEKALAGQADASFIIDALGIGIWKWDLITNSLDWDRNMYRLYGLDSKDFNGAYDAWENSLCVETKARAIKELNIAIAGGMPFDTTFQVVHRSSGKIQEIRSRAFVIRDDNGKPLRMWGINIDRTRESELEIELINERTKIAEDKINLLKAQFAQKTAEDKAATVLQEKLITDKAIKDRDDMLGVICHELKNPLTNMQLSTALLLKILPQTPELETARNIIGNLIPSIDRMSRLMSDLLDVTRIEAKSLNVDMKITLLDKIMIDISAFFMPSLNQKSIQLKTNIPSDCEKVLCDKDRTIQILINLVNNAIKFTESGGKINICAKKIGSMVEISVEDTGKGITEENLTHVFDRFWQEKNNAHIGTGIGLAISKGLVEAQEGKMSVKSKYGFGTTFCFTLKLAEAEN